MPNLILAYDLGTGGVKSSVFTEDGRSIAECFIPYDTRYPRSGYHEQKPLEWWHSIVNATNTVVESNGINSNDIVCLGVSGHSLGIVPIGKEKELLMDSVPIWSDSRAGVQAEKFFMKINKDEWYMTTGNGFPAHLYSIFKIMWVKEIHPEIYEQTEKFIGTKDYINFRMTGKLCTDYSYASGSGAYSLLDWKYVDRYIEAAGLSKDKFPQIVASTDVIGSILPEVARELGLGDHTLVVCGGVDNACMALGAGCTADGMAYTSVGSSAWIAVSGWTPILDLQYKPYVFTHCVPDMFVSSEAIFSAGNSFRWLRDNVCRNLLSEPNPYDAMTALARTVPLGANKLIFVPSLAGGSSLDKSPNIKGAFVGLHLGHTQADMIRATMEGICLNLKIALEVMEQKSVVSDEMLIVGGGGKSQFWRSLFADIYGKTILETNIGQDAGSLGAAALAAVGTGLWKSFGIVNQIHKEKGSIKPDFENHRKYEEILRLFKKVVSSQADIGDWIEQTNW